MFGNNPKRAPVIHDGTVLDVQDIFPTLQGEGPHTGTPAIFIRLGGCNLACHFCDTEFETYQPLSLEQILKAVEQKTRNQTIQLAVITGGEPLRQPVFRLCNKLIDQGYTVQIETNGTLYQELPPEVEIICSPKPGKQGYHPIRADLLARVTALKFIISVHDPLYRNIAPAGQYPASIPVYVQPMDEQDPIKNTANLDYTITLAMNKGYHLSLQTHKITGMP